MEFGPRPNRWCVNFVDLQFLDFETWTIFGTIGYGLLENESCKECVKHGETVGHLVLTLTSCVFTVLFFIYIHVWFRWTIKSINQDCFWFFRGSGIPKALKKTTTNLLPAIANPLVSGGIMMYLHAYLDADFVQLYLNSGYRNPSLQS